MLYYHTHDSSLDSQKNLEPLLFWQKVLRKDDNNLIVEKVIRITIQFMEFVGERLSKCMVACMWIAFIA